MAIGPCTPCIMNPTVSPKISPIVKIKYLFLFLVSYFVGTLKRRNFDHLFQVYILRPTAYSNRFSLSKSCIFFFFKMFGLTIKGAILFHIREIVYVILLNSKTRSSDPTMWTHCAPSILYRGLP